MSELLPAGIYKAAVFPIDGEKIQFGHTSKGTRQIAVCFEVIAGDEIGRKLTWFGFFGDQPSNGKNPTTATERTVKALRACGFKGDDLLTINDQELDQAVSITVEHEEYNGKVRAKVAWVNVARGGGFKLSAPMKKDDLRMFAAEMKMSVRRIPDAPGEKAVRGANAPSGEDAGDAPGTGDSHVGGSATDDDQIPF